MTDKNTSNIKIPAFSPREIVSELDRFIIGQADAKRAVAVALRNRWRRIQLRSRIARRSLSQKYSHDRANRCW